MRINKKAAAVAVAAVALAGTGVAYAFWTGSGTGTGQATTAANPAGLTVTQTSVITTLAPTTDVLQATPLAGKFINLNTAPVNVSQVNVRIDELAETTGDTVGTVWNSGCTATDYSLVQPTPQIGLVPVGTDVGGWSGASIRLVSSATVNQDGCKNQVVKLAYTTTTATGAPLATS